MYDKGSPGSTLYVQGFVELIIDLGAIVVLEKQMNCTDRERGRETIKLAEKTKLF